MGIDGKVFFVFPSNFISIPSGIRQQITAKESLPSALIWLVLAMLIFINIISLHYAIGISCME